MFEILPLTPELLAELGDELGGCDFTDPSQIDFLAKITPCDVQAAPGNGKTTLLAAKLALLSRNWTCLRHLAHQCRADRGRRFDRTSPDCGTPDGLSSFHGHGHSIYQPISRFALSSRPGLAPASD